MSNGWHRKRKDTAAEKERDKRYRTPEYRDADRRLTALVNAGRGNCWRCGGWIDPDRRDRAGKRAWHIGHDDSGTRIMGAEHNSCNLGTAAKRGAAVRNRTVRAVKPFSRNPAWNPRDGR